MGVDREVWSHLPSQPHYFKFSRKTYLFQQSVLWRQQVTRNYRFIVPHQSQSKKSHMRSYVNQQTRIKHIQLKTDSKCMDLSMLILHLKRIWWCLLRVPSTCPKRNRIVSKVATNLPNPHLKTFPCPSSWILQSLSYNLLDASIALNSPKVRKVKMDGPKNC